MVIIKLCPIINDKETWDSEPKNIVDDKGLHIFLGYIGDGLCLYPFSEVIHCYYYVSFLHECSMERIEHIYSLLSKWPWAYDKMQMVACDMDLRGMFLALQALMH